jgi:hypothetical protein
LSNERIKVTTEKKRDTKPMYKKNIGISLKKEE